MIREGCDERAIHEDTQSEGRGVYKYQQHSQAFKSVLTFSYLTSLMALTKRCMASSAIPRAPVNASGWMESKKKLLPGSRKCEEVMCGSRKVKESAFLHVPVEKDQTRLF